MIYVADFETNNSDNECRVWAWCVVAINDISEDSCIIGNDIASFISFAAENKGDYYFHNLKFDGEFLLNYYLRNGYYISDKLIGYKSITTLISGMGQYYKISVMEKNHTINYYDSAKIIPLRVDQMPGAFGLDGAKLKIDYKYIRPKDHVLTEDETNYIKEDVIIVAKSLKIMFEQNLTKMTIASDALADYKNIINKDRFNKLFPPLKYDADIRQAYKGGWTYVNKKVVNKEIGEGIVLDVNSLYPWVMRDCLLPYGYGKHFDGEYKCNDAYPLYIQMLRCNFKLKLNKLPTIQLKYSMYFSHTEYLEDSDGEDVVLCVTNIDLRLIKDHYNLYNVEYIGGWMFKGAHNLFNGYVNKWGSIKEKAVNDGNKGLKQVAKLMLNSLYGKFGKNPNIRSKIPYLDEGVIRYKTTDIKKETPIYLPIAAFVTAYARDKTIRAAQKCYNRFLYSDTDSIHLSGLEIPDGIEIDKSKLGKWKIENKFTRAKFIRAKTYIEEIDGKLAITCAGMPKECYKYVTWENFKPEAQYSGKKVPKHVRGGINLTETTFKIKSID